MNHWFFHYFSNIDNALLITHNSEYKSQNYRNNKYQKEFYIIKARKLILGKTRFRSHTGLVYISRNISLTYHKVYISRNGAYSQQYDIDSESGTKVTPFWSVSPANILASKATRLKKFFDFRVTIMNALNKHIRVVSWKS